jgi:hypothetical protein
MGGGRWEMGDGRWEMGVADARSGGFLRIERTKQGVGSWELGDGSWVALPFTLYPFPFPLSPKTYFFAAAIHS